MRNATDLLVSYATCHRDRRNIATHMVGIPMILFSLGLLLARPTMPVQGLLLNPAWVLFAAAALWWLTRGSLAVGLAVSAGTAALVLLAQAAGTSGAGLGWGFALFALGSLIQSLGHYYEGRKPAFVDDLRSLLIGPMFVAAEALFAAGWKLDLLREIERRAGPKIERDLALEGTR